MSAVCVLLILLCCAIVMVMKYCQVQHISINFLMIYRRVKHDTFVKSKKQKKRLLWLLSVSQSMITW